MKKRTLFFALVFVILMAIATLYFYPMELSDVLGDSSQIYITITEIGLKDGLPSITPVGYSDITAEQKNDILGICSRYAYRRTIATLFSDGSMSGLGDRILYFFCGEEGRTIVTVSTTGKIAIHDRVYRMNHAEQLIDQVAQVLEKPVQNG